MSEWKLSGTDLVTVNRPWMNLEKQPGFSQRAAMVADLVQLARELRFVQTVTDLGCGDGSLLYRLKLGENAWGYELGIGDVTYGHSCGLDIRQQDIVNGAGDLAYGDIIIVSEVLEHLDDPVAFLRRLPDRLLIASSPSRETGDWHNEIHSWAWDLDGYRDLLDRGGWRVIYQTECDGGPNMLCGVVQRQRFQAVVAVR
jgi:hypothetical protein